MRPRLEPLEDRTLPAPTVIGVSPVNLGVGVGSAAKISATFSTAINRATITASTFHVRTQAGTPVPGVVTYNSVNRTATLDTTATLAYATTYVATIQGGSGGVRDTLDAPLAANVSWSFTTAAHPEQGPGGPILVVTAASNPFSSYYPEILRAEGLNVFATQDIATVTAAALAARDVVILGEMPLTTAQVTLFTNYVQAGGNLIAMRPDKKLAGLLGLNTSTLTLSNAYLQVSTASGPGVGVTGQTIQFHGTADVYTLNQATLVARLYSTATAQTPNPAVTLRAVGGQGGQAAAFAYDLARSVVLTRQGNPAWAGQHRTGLFFSHSADLFYGPAAFDPRPHWNNPDRVGVPQADEQQRLLANLVLQMAVDRKPLPRFWYLPDGLKAVVLLTGDDHAEPGGTEGRFNDHLARGFSGGQPIRSSSYLFPISNASAPNPLTNSSAAALTASGFEAGMHVDTGCHDWTPAQLSSLYSSQLATWRATYPDLPSPSTHRTHCIVWSDYDTQPQVELAHRIRLDTTYYNFPETFAQNRPGLFTGSGLPMRFATAGGRTIDVYQAATQLTDESGQSYPSTVDALLDAALGPQGYYGVFTVNAHTDLAASPVSDAVIASAVARGVPVLSGRQVLEWLDGRNGSSFGGLAWNGTQRALTFTVTAAVGAGGLQAMLPTTTPHGSLGTITRGGSPVAFTRQTIKGIEYAFFPAAAGAYVARYDALERTVNGGSGTDTIVLRDRPGDSNFFEVRVNGLLRLDGRWDTPTNLTINGLAGNDAITIERSRPGVRVTVNGGYGNDTVSITPTARNLSTFQGDLTFNGGSDTDELHVHDQNSTSPNTYTVTATTVSRSGAALITYGGVQSLVVNAGGGNDTLAVQGTAAGASTIVNAGGGNDTITAGSGTLDGIQGALTVNGQAGTDALAANDPGTFTARTYTVTATSVSRSGTAAITYGTVETLALTAGGGNDTLSVRATGAGTQTTINAGAGNDTITVGSTGNSLSAIAGAMTVHGGDGTDVLNANDQGAFTAQTYTVTPTTLSRSSVALVTYGAVEGLVVAAGGSDDTINVQGTAPGTQTTVNAGGGSDTVNVRATAGPLTVIAGTGNDSIGVGSTADTLNAILGEVAVHGEGGTDTLTLNDQGNTSVAYHLVTPAQLGRLDVALVSYGSVESLAVNGGGGDDVFYLQGTAAGAPVAINGGGGDNYLVGPDAATTWNVTAANAGNLTGAALGSTATFAAVGNLLGGAGNDVFAFADGRSISGYVHGGDGTNRLDYSAYTSDVYVNLRTYEATAMAFVLNVQDVTGGTGNDILVGDSLSNVLNGGPGSDLLIAGGDDYALFSPDTLIGGGGEDILIGGWTAYDYDALALAAIRTAWTQPTSYDTRRTGLASGSGGPLLDATTVFYNYATGGNTLTGGAAELDLFFGDPALDVSDWAPHLGEELVPIF